jgi:O-antigen/teichoic acid export membrane protein
MVFVGTAVSQTFFQKAAETYRQGASLRYLLINTSKKLFLYSMPVFLTIMIFAPDIFALGFGKNWRDAGNYASWVALAYWVRFSVSPVSTIFIVVNKLKVGTLWQIIYFFSSFVVLGIAAVMAVPIRAFFFIYAVHEIIIYTVYFLMAYRVCDSGKLE